MGRSVSTHSNAVATVYLHPEFEEGSEDWAWDEFVEDLFDNVLEPRYPSLYKADRWEGRENHIIAENRYCEISVSEYCGLVAICLAPKDEFDEPLAAGWCARVADAFDAHITKMYKSSALDKLGTMSNGESVFRRIE